MAKLFAFEDNELDQSVDEVVIPEETASEASDAVEEASEIDAGIEATDDGVEAADQLTEVASVVESTIESGEGLEPVAAEAIRLAVESICSKVGTSSKAMYPLYATENFASKSSRLANSKLALETISDTIRNIWEKIMNFLKGLVQKVVNFWKGFMYNVKRTQNNLTALRKEVDKFKTSGKVIEDRKIGITPSSAMLAACILGKDDASVNNDKKSEEVQTCFEKASNSIITASEKLDEITKNAKSIANSPVYKSFDVNNTVLELPFAKSLHIEINTKSVDSTSPNEEVQTLLIKIESNNYQIPEGIKFDVLKAPDMLKLIKTMQTLLESTGKNSAKSNAIINAMEEANKKVNTKISELIKKDAGKNSETTNNDIDAKRVLIKNMGKQRTAVIAQMQAVSPSLNVLAVKTANAAITYIKKSMALYK